MPWLWLTLILLALILLVFTYDVTQRQNSIQRNFPVVGRFRSLLTNLGPKLRQYIVASNNEERPFSRDERHWVTASSEQQNNYFGFGTDNDLESAPNYPIFKHATLAHHFKLRPGYGAAPEWSLPCAKTLGAYRQRRKAFRPTSIVNVSAMSYGSLSAHAVEAINRGAALAGCLQNTGEGGISDHHRHGGDLIWQLGTGYFGARAADGSFDLSRFRDTVASASVRAIEIKLSQGAKPGHGGILPAAKITPEVSRIRGVPMGTDCVSPAYHTAFQGVDGLLDFVEMLADETGLPVGIKSAVGELEFWSQLVERMISTGRAVDYVAIDGGEGGTGAAPLVYSDHVALPFKIGFSRVLREFGKRDFHHNVVFMGAGKLGLPHSGLLAFALGCDLVYVAREPMLAIGCIQAQECHTGHCPTGVATQKKWLMRGLDPGTKSISLAHYIRALRREILEVTHTIGASHPALLTGTHMEILGPAFDSRSLREVFGVDPAWATPSPADLSLLDELLFAP